MSNTIQFETNEQKIEKYRDHPLVKEMIEKYEIAVKEREAKWSQAHMIYENTSNISEKANSDFISSVSVELSLFDEIISIIDTKIEAVK